MKKLLAGAVVALAALTTVACSVEEGENSGYLEEYEYILDSGRVVTCIVYDGFKAGGLSCDWGGAR